MTTVLALADGAQDGMKLLGELHAVKGAPARELLVKKRITIPGAGAFWKTYSAPLYDSQVMAEAEKRAPEGWSFSPKSCLGMTARAGKPPKGYVRRRIRGHDLCLPVYSPSALSPLAWRVVGYLPADRGYVAVARRRVGYWVWLALAALAVFGVAYLLFLWGPEALWNTVLDLPGALSDAWYRLLRGWGVV